jgi:hypothetical protein
MHRTRILLIVLVVFAGAPAAAQADDPNCHGLGIDKLSKCPPDRPLPTIQMVGSPHAGSPIELSASSVGFDTRYSWDLNGDGAYGDAFGATVTATFAVGQQSVGVRAYDAFLRTGIERRSFYVHAYNAKPLIHLDTGNGEQPVDEILKVTVTGEDVDGRVAKVEFDADGNGTYEISGPGPTLKTGVGFVLPGGHLVRARVTDDVGATVVATAVVRAEDKAPGAAVSAYADSVSDPVLPGVSTTVGAAATGFRAVRWEFDLDGDGTYETDRGSVSTARTTFTAGEHEFGVRATDADGATVTSVGNVTVDAEGGPVVTAGWDGGAYVGHQVKLAASAWPPTGSYTFEWDADGDGAFDDGIGRVMGNGTAQSTTLARSFTYPAVGTYMPRVRITQDASGDVRVLKRPIAVQDANMLPPAFGTLDLPGVTRAGVERTIEADAALTTSKLTFDLDGDGQFDEQPALGPLGYRWTFTEPVTIAVKATDTRTGASAVRTLDVHPVAGRSGPQANLDFDTWPLYGGATFRLAATASDAGDPACCLIEWDLDGDGNYDNGSAAAPALTRSTGTWTVGARVTNADGESSTTQRTFVVGTHPPKVDVAVSGRTVTAQASDPDGDPIVSYEWDTDGDGWFGYFDPKGRSITLPPGEHRIGIKVADPGGDVGIVYLTVTTTEPVVPTEGTPTPTPSPTATPAGPADPGTPAPTKPGVTVKAPKLATLLSKGITVSVGCKCASRITLGVDRATAKRLKLKSRELGRATGKGPTVPVKLNAKSRRALRHARSVKMRVAVAVGSGTVITTVVVKR